MRHLVILLASFGIGATAPAAEMLKVVGQAGRPGFLGDGQPAGAAALNQPFDVAFDAAGNLYISDTFNQRIRRVDAKSNIITTVAGNGQKGFSGDGGPATEARLDEPYGIVLDKAGNLYFADRLNRRVRRVDGKTGTITTLAGLGTKTFSGDGGPADHAGLVEPNGVALDREERRLFIADVAGHRIRVVDLDSGTIETLAGDGKARHSGDGGPARDASIFGARAVDVGPDGTVYVLEREGNTLRAIDPKTGFISTIAGTGQTGDSGDGGPARRATFHGPKELALDPKGNLFLVDTENNAIRRIDRETGAISTVAREWQVRLGENGASRTETLKRPHGVAIGPDGAIYIGDTEHHCIRKVFP